MPMFEGIRSHQLDGVWLEEGDQVGPAISRNVAFIHDHSGKDKVVDDDGGLVSVRIGKPTQSTDNNK